MALPQDEVRLAKSALAAIERDDSVELARLLEQGASPHGRWDPQEGARRQAEVDAASKQARRELYKQFGIEEEELPEPAVPLPPMPSFDGPDSWEIPVHLAARCGSMECLRLLLKRVDSNQKCVDGSTALFCAHSGEVVRVLIGAGAEIGVMNHSNHDALQEMLVGGLPYAGDNEAATLEACNALLHAGAPLMCQLGWAGRLHNAAFRQIPQAVRFLVDAGHPVDGEGGPTALHAICWQSDYHNRPNETARVIVRLLLKAGASIHARTEHGHTPLHEAVSGDGTNLTAAQELIDAGADVNAQNSEGQTPMHLHYDTLFDYERVVQFLLGHGANPLLQDKWGRTVIDIARLMIAGENPQWRKEQFAGDGGPQCGWKHAAEQGDTEYRTLELLERAAERMR